MFLTFGPTQRVWGIARRKENRDEKGATHSPEPSLELSSKMVSAPALHLDFGSWFHHVHRSISFTIADRHDINLRVPSRSACMHVSGMQRSCSCFECRYTVHPMDILEEFLELGRRVPWHLKFTCVFAHDFEVSVSTFIKMFSILRRRFPRRLLPHLVTSSICGLLQGQFEGVVGDRSREEWAPELLELGASTALAEDATKGGGAAWLQLWKSC